MSATLHARAKERFSELVERPPEDRQETLEALRREDPELHAEVVRWLAADEQTTEADFLDRPPAFLLGRPSWAPVPPAAGTEIRGDRGYGIVREIGRGGIGVRATSAPRTCSSVRSSSAPNASVSPIGCCDRRPGRPRRAAGWSQMAASSKRAPTRPPTT